MGYVMFLDESGDYSLSSIDDNFPIFCLVGASLRALITIKSPGHAWTPSRALLWFH